MNDVTLGNDWLERHCCTLNFGSMKLTIGGQETVPLTRHRLKRSQFLNLHDDNLNIYMTDKSWQTEKDQRPDEDNADNGRNAEGDLGSGTSNMEAVGKQKDDGRVGVLDTGSSGHSGGLVDIVASGAVNVGAEDESGDVVGAVYSGTVDEAVKGGSFGPGGSNEDHGWSADGDVVLGMIDTRNAGERADDVGVVLLRTDNSGHSDGVVKIADPGTVNVGVNREAGGATVVMVPGTVDLVAVNGSGVKGPGLIHTGVKMGPVVLTEW